MERVLNTGRLGRIDGIERTIGESGDFKVEAALTLYQWEERKGHRSM